MFRNVGIDVGGGDGLGIIQEAIRIMFVVSPDRAEELCAFAEAGDLDGYVGLVQEVTPTAPPEEAVTTSKQLTSDYMSQPTSADNVYGNPEYGIIDGGLQISIQMVRAQDRAGAVYDEGRFHRCLLIFLLRLFMYC